MILPCGKKYAYDGITSGKHANVSMVGVLTQLRGLFLKIGGVLRLLDEFVKTSLGSEADGCFFRRLTKDRRNWARKPAVDS